MEIGRREAEISGGDAFDITGLQNWRGSLHVVMKGMLGDRNRQGLMGHGGEGDELDEGAFEFADVAFDVLGDVFDDGFGNLFGEFDGVASEDFASGDEVGGFDFDDHSADESIDERFGELSDHFGMGVGGHDDLFSDGVDVVEGVEEFFLSGLLVGEEMDVVDDEHVDASEFFSEGVARSGFDGVDESVGEFLAGGADPSQVGLLLFVSVANGLKQVCFSESASAVDEKRIELLRGLFRDAFCGGEGDLVGLALDEGVESAPEGLGGGAIAGLALMSGGAVGVVLDVFRLGIELSFSDLGHDAGIDGVGDVILPAGDFRGGAGDGFGKMVFDPIADEDVGDADFEEFIGHGEFGGVFEPDLITLGSDHLRDSGLNSSYCIRTDCAHKGLLPV